MLVKEPITDCNNCPYLVDITYPEELIQTLKENRIIPSYRERYCGIYKEEIMANQHNIPAPLECCRQTKYTQESIDEAIQFLININYIPQL